MQESHCRPMNRKLTTVVDNWRHQTIILPLCINASGHGDSRHFRKCGVDSRTGITFILTKQISTHTCLELSPRNGINLLKEQERLMECGKCGSSILHMLNSCLLFTATWLDSTVTRHLVSASTDEKWGFIIARKVKKIYARFSKTGGKNSHLFRNKHGS